MALQDQRGMRQSNSEDLNNTGGNKKASLVTAGLNDSGHAAYVPTPETEQTSGNNAPSYETRPSSAPAVQMSFAEGALRITRTPGRSVGIRSRNTIALTDLIHKDRLVSACIFAFFIAREELFRHLPLGLDQQRNVPIYIGRDAKMDPYLTRGLTPFLQNLYRQEYGQNYNAFYAWSPGCSHSKLMALIYPTYLRIVITSANTKACCIGDNHWYIHDLPMRAHFAKAASSEFESDFIDHLESLSVPKVFLDQIRGKYDWSSVRVCLVTSVPGAHSGFQADQYSLLRLRKVVKDLGQKLPKLDSDGRFQIEICSASVGNLNAHWIDAFYDCASGRKRLSLPDRGDDVDIPNITLVFPTSSDVRCCSEDSQQGANSIGCHLRPWSTAPLAIKQLFRRYSSLDEGRLFHHKLIFAYDPTNESGTPYFVYIGSANFTATAWGTLEVDKRGNDRTCNTKIVKVGNYECGVMIPGHLIVSLLEPGTTDWRAIIPYERPSKAYNLKADKPWNDPRWVTGKKANAGQ